MNVSGRSSRTSLKRMDNKFLEQFYETVILPRYKEAISFGDITWVDHGKVGMDALGALF